MKLTTIKELKIYYYGQGLWAAGDIGREELEEAIADFSSCITVEAFQNVALMWQERAEEVERNRRCCQIVEDREERRV